MSRPDILERSLRTLLIIGGNSLKREESASKNNSLADNNLDLEIFNILLS